MNNDLASEFLAARAALASEHRKMLWAAGVPSNAVDLWGLVGVARIEIDKEIFNLAQSGQEAFVVPVRVDPEARAVDIDHPAPVEAVLFGDTIDLVAFRLDDPRWFATRTGNAPTLGQAMFADAEPTNVWRGPLAWLQARCRGIVPLSRDPVELRATLMRVGPIVAEDIDHGREIDKLLSRPLPCPPIFVQKAVAA